MLKVAWFVRARDGVDRDAALRAWTEDHGDLALAVPGIRGYREDRWIEDLGGGDDLPFHRSSEIWYDDEAMMASKEWRALVDGGADIYDASTLVGGAVDERVLLAGPRDLGAVKTMWTVRFRAGLEPDEARGRWLVEHAPLVLAVPGVVRYEQNHAATSEAFEGRLDGFFSIWFSSQRALREALETEQWVRASRATSRFAAPACVRGVRIAEHVTR